MYTIGGQRGFTLVEILVVLTILIIIGVFSYSTFRGIYQASARRIVAEEVADALREARNNTIGSKSDTVYGVRVATSSVTRFSGLLYTPGHASNTVYTFSGGVTATGTIVSQGTNIVFALLTGTPSATGTILIQNGDRTSTTTISIGATGLIQ
jgi:prepilin-type N-terminal cleavage/methylation domain-containing protein